MSSNSEALLTQILYLVQELHNEVTVFNQRLAQCEQLTSELQIKMQNLISTAFPEGDLEAHRLWHERKFGSFRRFLIKLLS